jgi:hypothetical protein
MTPANWIYLFFVILVVVAMIGKRGVVLITTVGTFAIGLHFTNSVVGALQTVFRAYFNAGTSLFDLILLIGLMVSMLKAMESMGADYLMVYPIRAVLRNPTVSFFVLGFVMYIASLFFWPTPATALVGTVLIPVAVRSGLPLMGAAMAVNIFGHGMGLSGDLVIQGAPALTSRAAGVDISSVVNAGGILSLTAGITAAVVAYFSIRKEITDPSRSGADAREEEAREEFGRGAKWIAVAVPVAFTVATITMVSRGISGAGSTALLGGVAALFLMTACVLDHGKRALEAMEGYIIEGLTFSMKIFAVVIPIAGFFYLGSPSNSQAILGEGAPGFLFEIGKAVAETVPLSPIPVAFGMLIVGLVTGLDGSGFSGLPLVGTLASSLGSTMDINIGALAAIGQISSIFCGGGTLVAWATVAVAGIAGVSPLELARKNFVPVITGLIVATTVGTFLL